MIKHAKLNYYFWKNLLQIQIFSDLYQIVFFKYKLNLFYL